ncbi:MAG: sensor histidine kinase [Candidatus Brocadiia bacterium]
MSSQPPPPSPPASPPDGWQHVVTLAAGLAHEIKNPLSTINLNLQLLQEDWQNADSPKEKRTLKRLQTLQRETSRLAGLLEDFLRYARTQSIEPQACQLNDLIGEILDLVAPQAAQQHVEVRTRLAPDLPPIQADPKLLKQALLNLVINAEQAMPEGGELLVETSPGDHHVQVDVTDTGRGIPDHHRAKIFDVYFSTKKEGSGLGLPTAQRILHLHGGSLDLESEVGKGTRFTARIPIEPPHGDREEQRP